MHVARPPFRWEWNLNTIVVLVGFGSGLVAWGYAIAEMRTGQSVNAVSIERLDRRMTTIEVEHRRLDNHELRLAAVEKQATDGATAMRAVESTLNSLTGDIRVMREILQRLEASQNGRDTRP